MNEVLVTLVPLPTPTWTWAVAAVLIKISEYQTTPATSATIMHAPQDDAGALEALNSPAAPVARSAGGEVTAGKSDPHPARND